MLRPKRGGWSNLSASPGSVSASSGLRACSCGDEPHPGRLDHHRRPRDGLARSGRCGGSGAAQSEDPLGARALFAIALAIYLGLVIAVLTAAKWRGKSQWRDLVGWRGFRLADKVIWAVMLAALIYSASADAAIGHFLPHPAGRLTIPADRLAAAELFVLAVMLAPITEELVFRGWIYTSLRLSLGLLAGAADDVGAFRARPL